MGNGDTTIEVRGVKVPAIGFGTWLLTGQDATDGVRDALAIGYRQIDTARAYENEREVGRSREIGVSNFPAGLLKQALDIAPVFCDQVEYHPLLDQSRLLELARANDVLITAYSPLAHGKVPDDETLRRVGDNHGMTAGQVALRWLLDQPGVSPIPKTSSHGRRQENFDVFDFSLTEDEREEIARLPKDVRTANPPWAPDWDA
jgi:2,5-diketo-D-gluconate reductase B